jgi:predicted Zn-dependent protease
LIHKLVGCHLRRPDGGRRPIGDVRIEGDALDLLGRLEAIGDDPGCESISCEKRGQWVGVGIQSPSMRFGTVPWVANATVRPA